MELHGISVLFIFSTSEIEDLVLSVQLPEGPEVFTAQIANLSL